ncbi:MAG: adenosine deaminase [Acidimicrobiia bacterium]|nr:adenosine deaminase [Acidimicrobiia bacterium]
MSTTRRAFSREVEVSFLTGLPKAELHVHIEGTLEPEMMFDIGRRNGVELGYASPDEIRAAYEFNSLQDFLDIYYLGAAVLQHEQDFFDLAYGYFERAAADGVRRSEIFFDPQTHTDRGIPIGVVISGLAGAAERASSELDMSCDLILCFLRHLPANAAMETLESALDHRESFIGVGLDSSEVGFPPRLFTDVFARARSEGLRVVAHAGEEGPPEYVHQALDLLGAERIDHGVRSLEDPGLVERLVADQIPLTVCPLSNVKLAVVESMSDHPLATMIDAGLLVTINSDDPAYFGGYVGKNYEAVANALALDDSVMARLAKNSISASFLDDISKTSLLSEIDAYVAS